MRVRRVARTRARTGHRMRGRVNKVANETLHGTVSNFIRSKIYAKELAPNDRIPSEHQLMEAFDVSRGTVRKALKTLVDEGLVVQEHGRGNFVSAPCVKRPGTDKPFSFAESLIERGVAFDTVVLEKEDIAASADVAARLQIEAGAQVLRLRRVRYAAGKPIMVLDTWTPVDPCPGIMDLPFDRISLFNAIERTSGKRIAYSSMAYSARVAGKELARIMRVPESSPVLNLEQIMVLEDGSPIEWGDTMLGAGQTIVGMARQTADTKIHFEEGAPW